MRVYTPIDSIVRSSLMSYGLTLHNYVQFLHFALQGLREIEYDTIGKIATAKIQVDSNGEVKLPSDYVDWVKVGWERNRHIIPLGSNGTWVREPNTDNAGNQIPYGTQSGSTVSATMYDPFASYNISQYGEDFGRQYGLGLGDRTDCFQVIDERSVMLIGRFIPSGEYIYIEYLASANYADTDALVHPYAESTVEAYIKWKYAEQKTSRLADIDRSKKEFYNQYRILRARMNDIGKEDMLRLSRDGIKQSIKT